MAYKASKGVGERQLRNRTRDFQRMGGTISGRQIDVLVTQHLKTKSREEREQIIKDALGHDLVMELPDRQTIAMKEDLALSWYKLNQLRR